MGIFSHAYQVVKRLFQKRKHYPERTRRHPEKYSFLKPGIEQLEDRTLLSVSPALFDAILMPQSRILGDAAQVAVVNYTAPVDAAPSSYANVGAGGASDLIANFAQRVKASASGIGSSVEVAQAPYASYVNNQPAASNVVFIDGNVPNYDELIRSFGGSASSASSVSIGTADGPVVQVSRFGDTDVVVLDSGYDGIQQITNVLQNYRGLTSQQIVSHGGAGEVQLGSTILDQRTLEQNQAAIASWGQALRPDGDLLLFGCDVAQGSAGTQFVQSLAQLTDADVAASTNLTGAAALGGDWNLEYSTGVIEAESAFSADELANYNNVLVISLHTYIQDLLAANSSSFTSTEPIIATATLVASTGSLGGFLELNQVTLTVNATFTSGTPGVWSGSVGISASTASLYAGTNFSASITTLTGTYTIGAGYALTASQMSLKIGEALSISASNVNLAYNPAGAANQTLVTLSTATVQSGQFAGMPSGTLSNFKLRADGFSIGDFTLNSAGGSNPAIGDFFKATSVALTVSNFDAKFGSLLDSSLSAASFAGTVGIVITGPQLFPNGNYVQFQSSSVAAAYSFAGFDGTSPTGQLSVTISGLQLAMGDALNLAATGDVVLTPGFDGNMQVPADEPVTIAGANTTSIVLVKSKVTLPTVIVKSTPQGGGTSTLAEGASNDYTLSTNTAGVTTVTFNAGRIPVLGTSIRINYNYERPIATIAGVTVSSPRFAGLGSATLNNLIIRQTGFSLGSLSWSSTTDIVIGSDILTLKAQSSVQANDPATVAGANTTTIALAKTNVTEATVVVTMTPQGGTTPVTLVVGAGNDYTLNTNGATGLTTLTFNAGRIPAQGSSIGISYTYRRPAVTVAVKDLVFNYAKTVTESLDWVSGTTMTLAQTPLSLTTVIVTSQPSGGGTITTRTLNTDYTLATVAGNTQVTFTGFTPSAGIKIRVKYQIAPTVNGSIVFDANGVVLFPNIPLLNLSLSNLTGSFDFGTLNTNGAPGIMTLSVNNLNIPLGDALTLNLGNVTISPGLSTMLQAVNVKVTSNLLTGFPDFNLASFDLLQTGFNIGTFQISLGTEIKIGDFISFTNASINVTNFKVDKTSANVVSGTIDVTFGTMTLFPGNSAVTSTFTNLTGSFDVASSTTPGRFRLAASRIVLSLFSQFTLTADNVTLTPGLDTLATIGSATLVFAPLNNLTFNVSNVEIKKSGFSIGNASVSVNDLTLGSLVTLTAPTVSISGLGYTFGGSLRGTVGLSAGATLHLGSAFNVSVASSVGSYDLVSKALSLQLSNFVIGIAGFAQVTIASAGLLYSPAVDNTAKILIGATGVSGFVGVSGSTPVGATLSNGKLGLALYKKANGDISYALDVSGAVALVGLPSSTLAFSAGNIQFRKNNAGRVNEVISVDGTPANDLYVDFAGNETIAMGRGVSLSVGTFASITGDFAFKTFADGAGTDIAIAANNVNATVSAGSQSIIVKGASLGLIVKPGATAAATTYALVVNAGTASVEGVTGLTLSSTGLKVRVRKGLDTTDANLVAGLGLLANSISTPSLPATAVESMTWANGATISLANNPATLVGVVVATTPSGGGAVTTLVQGTDYNLVDVSGSIQVQFITGRAPTVGAIVGITYSYLVPQAVTLDFSGLGSTDVTDIQGQATIAVAGFASLSGDFGFQKFTPTTGPATFAIGAKNVSTVMGTSSGANVTVSSGTLGMLIQGANYALVAGGDVALNNVSGLTATASNVKVRVRRGLDITAVAGVPVVQTSGGDVTLDFTGLGSTDVTSIEGDATLAVANFGSLAGKFGFQAYEDGATGAQQFAIGATDVTAILGTVGTNLTLANASFGLIVRPGSGINPTTYALQAKGSSNPADTSLNGVTGLTLNASNLMVRVRKGLDVSAASAFPTTIQTSGGNVTLDFSGLGAGSTDVFDVQGAVKLSVGGFVDLEGRFGFQRYVTGGDNYYAFGMDGKITLSTGTKSLTLDDVSVGVLVKRTSGGTTTYALQAKASSDPAKTTFVGPGGLTMSASDFVVRVKRGLDLSSYPAGVPTTIALAAATKVAPELVTVASNTTKITLAYAQTISTSVVVKFGTVTKTVGTDYTLGLDVNGFVTVNFSTAQKPSDGTTVRINYTYQSQPASSVALDFGALGAGVADFTDIQGHAKITVANFASLEGDFGFQKYTPSVGAATIVIGGKNINVVMGTADTNLTVTNGEFGLIMQDGNYALVANAGTIALNGVPGLALASSNLQVRVRRGLDTSSISGLPTFVSVAGSTVALDFTGIAGGTSNVTAIQGTTTISIANFASLSGTFSFSTETSGTVTKILVGGSGISAFLGADSTLGIQITGASFGLAIFRDSTQVGSKYALQASAPNISIVGLPSEISLTGSVDVAINTTGSVVQETIAAGTNINFTTAANIKSLGGSLTLGITPSTGTAFTLSGNFSITKTVTGAISKLLIGATNIGTTGTPVLAENGSSYNLSSGTLGLVFYKNTVTSTSLGYALNVSATAMLSGAGVAASTTLNLRRNTTTTAQNDTVFVGATSVPVVFASTEVKVSTTPFQKISFRDSTVTLGDSLIVAVDSGLGDAATHPTANADTKTLTGVSLTLQDGLTGPAIFTISAETAAYTTFTGAATSGGGLNIRDDGQSWIVGDKDFKMTKISFTIGTYVRFTADSVDVQRFTVNSVVTNAFNFTNATVAFLSDGTPMASLSGNAKFKFTTGGTPAQNGFKMSSFAITNFSFLDQTAELAANPSTAAATPRKLGAITLPTNPAAPGNAITFSDFSFDLTGQVSAQIGITIGSGKIGAGPVSASFTNLTGTFQVGVKFNLANLMAGPTSASVSFVSLKAATVEVNLGPYVKLSATNVTITPMAKAAEELIAFGSLTATLTIPGPAISFSGSVSNFAITGDGTFVAKTNFGVGFSFGGAATGAAATKLNLPPWLPLQSLDIKLVWPNFNADKSKFLIQISAAVNFTGLKGAPLTVTGSIINCVIDPELLQLGKFPVISIDGAALQIAGNLFAGRIDGTLIFGVVRYDSAFREVDGFGFLKGTTTLGTKFTDGTFGSAFYGAIAAAFDMGTMSFAIRIGISEFGPLEIYLEAGVPVPLGPTTLFLSNFRGGVKFGISFPTISISDPPSADDALSLRGPGFVTPSELTADQWTSQLRGQVLVQAQANSGGAGPAGFGAGPVIIQAGVTVYSVDDKVFRVDGDIFIDTSGKFLIIGTGTFSDSMTIGVKMFTDLSKVFAGTAATASVLFLMENPAQNSDAGQLLGGPIYSVFGVFTIQESPVFRISLAGAFEYRAMNVVMLRIQATVMLTFTSDSFTIEVANAALFVPIIQSAAVGDAAGKLTIQTDSAGKVNIWGGFLLQPNLSFLTPLGITVGGQVFINLNTSSLLKSVTLTTTNGPVTLDLAANSFRFFITGYADFVISGVKIFRLSGTLALEIAENHLSVFVVASLLLGQNSDNPIMTFDASGLIHVQLKAVSGVNAGFAAKMTLTMGANIPGVSIAARWLLVVNTTESTIYYTIPAPVATIPAVSPIPTVMGPDYSSSNILALTSYEIMVNGQRTLIIPAGRPKTTLSNYSTWTPAFASKYFMILGRGELNIGNMITMSGNLNIIGEVRGSSVNFIMNADTKLLVKLNGNTIFQFDAVGAIQINNSGIAAVITIKFSTGTSVASSLGFGLTGTFRLELNTTNGNVTIGGVTIPSQAVLIRATGNLTLLGGVVNLSGTYVISITTTSATIGIDARVTFFGATFNASGFAGIYYDSNPGLALRIGLSLLGGAQGIAPISSIGSNFVISGSFGLELNTSGVARNDQNGGSIDPGFKVSVTNLGVYFYGFQLTGSVTIYISNQGFGFDVNLTLNFFGLASLNFTGYYRPWGEFYFSAEAGFQFGDRVFGCGGSLRIAAFGGGSLGTGFSIRLSGWAAFLGISIGVSGEVTISNRAVSISVTATIVIIPEIDWGLLGTSPAVTISHTETFNLGTTAVAPSVAQVIPPPTPPHLADVISGGVLRLNVGQDVQYRLNDDTPKVLTDAVAEEKYNLKKDGSGNIIVSALGLEQSYSGVSRILVTNTSTGNDTIAIDNSVDIPVDITLGSGNNTVTTGSGAATVTIDGDGSNTIIASDFAVITVNNGAAGFNLISAGNNSSFVIHASGSGANTIIAGANANVIVNGNESNTINLSNGNSGVTINGTGKNAVNVTGGTPTVNVTNGASGNNVVMVNSGSASAITIAGNGNNVVSSVGSGASTITVTGNGGNVVTTGGPSDVYLRGTGNNQVTTGAGAVSLYDQGIGANSVQGGTGGGTMYYGLNSSASAYSSKGKSQYSAPNGNFLLIASGYATYLFSDTALKSGSYVLGLNGLRSAILNAATATTNTFTLEGWSGSATLNGVGTTNTMNFKPSTTVTSVNYLLSNTALQVTGGVTQTITLNTIQTANLTGAIAGVNNYNITAWTGNGSLTGPVNTTNTLIATNDVDFTLSNTLFTRTGGFGNMTLSGIQNATLTGGGSANRFTISGWTGNADLFGLEANDIYDLTLLGAGTGVINVTDAGSAPPPNTRFDILNITTSNTTRVTSTSVRVGTQRVNYTGIEFLNVTGAVNGLTYNVQSTGSAVSSKVATTGNNNVINVSSTAGEQPVTPGNLNGILGFLDILVGSFLNNVLRISDLAGTTNKTVTLTNARITGFAPALIDYSGTFTNALGTADGIKLEGSTTNATTFNIQSTLQDSTTWVQGGSANDVFNIGTTGNSLGLIKGLLTVQGGIGSGDFVGSTTLSASSPTASLSPSRTLPVGDIVNVNDQGDNTTGFAYTLTDSTLDRSDLPQTTPAITYGNVETVNVNTGLQSSNINVTSTAANVNTTVKGSVNTTATQNSFNITATGAGSNNSFVAGTGDTSFKLQSTGQSSFTNIQGNGGNDNVLVSSNAFAGTRGDTDSINGNLSIDAGAGTNNRLTFDDYTGVTRTEVIVYSDAITGLAPADIFYTATGGHFLDTTTDLWDGILVSGSNNGGNSFTVRGTRFGSTTEINGGGANDFFNVSSNAVTLDSIQGHLTLIGGTGIANRLIVSDFGNITSAAARSNIIQTEVTLAGRTFQQVQNFAGTVAAGVGATKINYVAVGGFNNVVRGVERGDGIELIGSNKLASTFTFRTTVARSTITGKGGNANDTFNIGSPLTTLPGNTGDNGDLDLIRGRLRIVAGTTNGTDRTDLIFIDDYAKVGRANYLITPTSVTSYDLPPTFVSAAPVGNVDPVRPLFAGIDYDGSAEFLSMVGNDAVNIFNVQPSKDTEISFDGRLPVPGVAVLGGGDYLLLDTQTTGTTGRKLHSTGLGQGYWDFTSVHKRVNYQSMERFNHVDIVALAVVGSANSLPTVTVKDAETGEVKYQFTPYQNTYRGSVQVATGDVDLDGIPDVVVAPGASHVPLVKIYRGSPDASGGYPAAEEYSFFAYSQQYLDGVNLAIGDINADGAPEIVTSTFGGAVPEVRIFQVNTNLGLVQSTSLRSSFNAFENPYRGYVSVAVGDIDLDGYAEIVTGREPGFGPTVHVYNGKTLGLVNRFWAFSQAYQGPVYVGIGDFNQDLKREIITSAGPGFLPTVRVFQATNIFTGVTPTLQTEFLATASSVRTGVLIQIATLVGGNPGFVEPVQICTAYGNFTRANTSGAASTPLTISTLSNVSTTNVSVQAEITLAAAEGTQLSGLIARYQGSGDNNMYLGAVYVTGSSMSAVIYRNFNGVWKLLAEQSLGAFVATSQILRFEVFNDSLKLFVNDSLKVWANDSSIAGTGTSLAGYRTYSSATSGAIYSNVNSTPIVALAPTLATPFSDSFSPTLTNDAVANGIGGTKLVLITTSNALGLLVGQSVYLANLTGGLAAALNNKMFVISAVTDTTFTLEGTTGLTGTATSGTWTLVSQLKRNWMEHVGNFTVAGGVLTTNSPLAVATLNSVPQADVVVTDSVTLPDGQAAGLMARYSGPGDANYYYAFLTRSIAYRQFVISCAAQEARMRLRRQGCKHFLVRR